MWVEVGSMTWWSGVAVLVFLGLGLFYWAPRKGHPALEKWLSLVGVVILLNLVLYWALSIHDGIFTLADSLPLHMCGISQILLFVHLTLKKKWAFPLAAFWGPLGGIFAFIIPTIRSHEWIYIAQFYLSHSAVVLVPIYLLVRCGRRLPRGAFWRTILITNIVGFSMVAVNHFLGSNYWFVNAAPPGFGFAGWPWYLAFFELLLLLMFGLFWLGFRRFVQPGEA